ncbi:hypothetical protein J2129_002580 [Methanofollis sp. W23]|nr:hypothetical protein [Methanofollis sp. W23]
MRGEFLTFLLRTHASSLALIDRAGRERAPSARRGGKHVIRRPLIPLNHYLYRGGRAATRLVKDSITHLTFIYSAFPASSWSQGPGGSAPGMMIWEGTSVRMAAPNRRIVTATPHQGRGRTPPFLSS